MTAELLARLGGPVAAGGLALLVLASPRPARLAGLALWAAGMALFVPVLAPSGHVGLLVAGGILAVAGAAVLAVVFRWQPWALALLALAAAPARVPVAVGEVSASLLVPLYAVVAGAALALGWSLWRDAGRRRELGVLSWPLALFVLWLGLSALWTNDPEEAALQLFFFVVPFALLTVALARLPWSDSGLAWLSGLLGAMALLFGGVGLWQWATRDIFWNPKVIEDNAYAPFFRVNSLFWDPSIYGRFLVVTILVALVFLLFGRWRRLDAPLVLLIAGLWAALLFSFSQSSFAALVVGIVLAAVLAWRWRAAVAVGLVAAVMIPVGVAAPQLENVRDSVVSTSGDGLDRATGGRFELVSKGVRIAADHPLVGVGVGGFEEAYTERVEGPRRFDEPASHNVVVTMAAETGVVGLVLFAWLVAAAFVVAFRRTRAAPRPVRIAGLVAGIGLFAVFVHGLFYDAFLEDPLVWVFFALAALAARESTPAEGAPPAARATASGRR
ncbi:MAG: O-antigen ligase family protein [Gaiellaceae bacterium]